MITKLLIANRGEIACRIIKTAQRLGLKTVAIYSDADATSQHVKLADEAWRVGPSLVSDSYLRIDNIMQIAQEACVSAIHPGYGFLSENPEFAQACSDQKICFVGPSVHAMNAMASKQLAKQLLANSGVPLTPGYHGEDQSPQHLFKEAERIGFPVLLKAAMGGGGKGMRAVHHPYEFQEALAAAKREALAYFKNDTMLIEKLIANPRHVEIQIMADNHGHVVHLFERDCSIQRRHQKVIEEAPAPHLSTDLRASLAKAAITVARTIDYSGAGTIEFLVDNQAETFYFMEMNTRLQVEHPVTEMITGLDLVEWQLRIAANEKLPLTQEQIHAKGHAIECRVYAEDPQQGFLPSVGKVSFLKEPQGEGIRIDSAIEEGDSISRFYDAMFAKLIVWGETRSQAILRLQQALSHYQVAGIKTNLSFLQSITHEYDFIHANLSTDFLTTHPFEPTSSEDEPALLFAAAFDYIQCLPSDPLFIATWGWQMHQNSCWVKRYQINEQLYTVEVRPLGLNTIELRHQNKTYTISHLSFEKQTLRLTLPEKTLSARVIKNDENTLVIFSMNQTTTVEIVLHTQISSEPTSLHSLSAPMPSTVVAILKNEGDNVCTGDGLIVLEAMKMEHTIYAPEPGLLSSIFFKVGSQVNEGAILASITPTHTES